MAIVGTAYVRLRVIGDKLKKDIGDSVSKAVDDSTADLDKVGKTIGEKLSDSTSKEVERSLGSQMGRISDEIGETIGRRMAQNLDFSLRSHLPKSIQGAMTRLTPVVSRAGDKLGDAFGSFKTKLDKTFNGKGKGGLGGILMGSIGPIITILPSVLAGAGAVIGAYAATAVTAIASLGPAAAGASLAAVPAFSAIKISAGLVGLAMKYPSDALTDFQERAQTFKGLIATPVQAGLLSGLNASMRLLSPMMTALKPQFTELGIAVGDIAIGFADAIRQGVMFDRVGRILDTNNQFVRDAGGGVSKLGQAFIVLLDHLRPVTQQIGEMVGQFGDWALNAINAASASGKLDGWITRMWDSFRRLMGIVTDFGIGIYNVFSAAQPAAGNLTTSLENIARKFREWTGDPANQERMVNFFEKMRVIVAQVNDILGDLVTAGLRGLENTDLTSLSAGLETLRSLGPPIAQMFRAIQEAAGPQLLTAFQNFADIITSLADSGVIGIIAGAFGNLLAVVSWLLNLPFVGQILGWLAGFATLAKTLGMLTSVAGMLWRLALQPLIAAISALAAVVGWPVVLIGALVAALIWFFTQTEIGQKIVSAAWDMIKAAMSAAIDGIMAAIDWLVGAFQNAWTWIQNASQGIWNAVSTAFNAVLATVQTVWNTVSTFLITVVTNIWNFITTAFTAVQNTIVGVWNAVWGFIQPIIQGIADFISTTISFIVTGVEMYLNILWEVWSRVWPLLALPVRVVIGVILLIWEGLQIAISAAVDFISNVITVAWTAIFTFLQATMETIRNVITTVWNAIYSFISGLLTTIGNFIRGVWDNIYAWVSAALDRIWRGMQNIWNAIWGFIQPILNTIGNFIRDTWNTISNAISTVMNAIRNVITTVWNAVSGFISSVVGTIRSTITSVWNGISSAISSTMSTIRSTIESVWNSITGFLQGAMDTIRGIVGGVWDALQGAGDSVVSGLKSAVNGAIGIVNSAISGINGMIGAANMLPGVDIPKISPIPKLAKGGTVSPRGGGTLAMIAEAGRPERVEPLDPQGLSKRDRAMIEFLAGGAGGATNVNVYLGVGQLVPLIAEVVEEKQDDLANRVLTGTKG